MNPEELEELDWMPEEPPGWGESNFNEDGGELSDADFADAP